jgi:hypothetical protein
MAATTTGAASGSDETKAVLTAATTAKPIGEYSVTDVSGREIELASLWSDHISVVLFLRHFL